MLCIKHIISALIPMRSNHQKTWLMSCLWCRNPSNKFGLVLGNKCKISRPMVWILLSLRTKPSASYISSYISASVSYGLPCMTIAKGVLTCQTCFVFSSLSTAWALSRLALSCNFARVKLAVWISTICACMVSRPPTF
jgi:hypothetical protein